MILTDKELKERVIIDPSKIKEAYTWWEKSQWDKIRDSILIDPFEPEKLGTSCYDLSVGEEYVSLRDPYNIKRIKEGEAINIDPLETVLILTWEFIALPKNVVAMIVPRARWIFEGTMLSATRVDSTWYGKLLVGFTNITKWRISLRFKTAFCTCYFLKCADVEKHLTKKDIPFLGRKTIDPLTFTYAQPQRLLTPSEFRRTHLNNVVNSFGYPWDVVQCAIERAKDETITHLEREVAPNIVEEVTLKVTERAYKELLDLHKEYLKTQRLLTKALIGFVITIAVAVVLAVLRLVNLV
jgi:deoxycytidine triphosphate deaminase